MFLLLILPLTAVIVPSASPQALCADKGGKVEESSTNEILKIINNRRKNLAKGLVKDQANAALPKAKLMNKLAWDCDLEVAAKAKLSCPAKGSTPTEPKPDAGNTGYFFDDADQDGYPMSVVVSKWIDEIKAKAYTGTKGTTEVKAPNPVGTDFKNFANLMRSDLTKIGCAELECPDDGKTLVFCLTDKDPIAADGPIYEVPTSGAGGCAADADCASSTLKKCDTTMGLCYEPVATTTAATTTAATTTGVTTTASYAGELPTGTSSQCKGNVGMTDELRMHFLDTHNYRRSILAKGQVQRPSGNYLPNGANIIKLKLNCDLEKEAIEEVRQCPTSKKPHSTYGKNFDTFASSTATSTYRDAIKKAVTNWWKVSRTESNGPGMQVTFRSNHVNQPVETYTQIAWANTKDIGCAVAKCTSSYTVVCLYEPKGNIVDQVMYRTGTPCAACPSGTTCDSALGLCVQN